MTTTKRPASAFTFCHDCLLLYQSLRFDAAASPRCNTIPFCTIFWPDEHPFVNGRFGPLALHRDCYTSDNDCYHTAITLVSARSSIWCQGSLDAKYHDFWTRAQEQIPDWPGFRRIKLTIEQRRFLPKWQRGPGNATLGLPCPYCGAPLRTPKAQQCLSCGADWHEPLAESAS